MGGWMDGWMDGWLNGWIYGWMDGWWLDMCRGHGSNHGYSGQMSRGRGTSGRRSDLQFSLSLGII